MLSEEILDEKIAAVDSAISEYIDDEDSIAVYMTGSLAAGLGTEYSDIDITVVTDRYDGFIQRGIGTNRIDIAFRSSEWRDEQSEQPWVLD